MPVVFMTIGSTLAILGFVLLIRAIIGRQVSDHPYCRGCRYDLVGLDISSSAPCPECGNAVLIDSRSVINGQRRVRFVLLLIALMMMTVGSAGIGWSSIKRHPRFEYVDWYVMYEKSPEPALRLYVALNDEEAANELWRRIYKSKISDKGLRILIDRAMERIADPSAQYDSRGGSVLLYALYDDQLTDLERKTFIEGSVTSKMHLYELQDNDSAKAYAQISHHGIERFMASWSVTYPLQRKKQPLGTIRAASNYVIQCMPQILTINGKPTANQDQWLTTSNDWTTIQPEFATSSIHIPFPIDEQKLDATIAINYVLMQGDTQVHTWQQTINTSIQRAIGTVEHAQHIEDPAIINPILSNMNIGAVYVPTQTDLARQGEYGLSFRPVAPLYSDKLFDHKLLGDIRFCIGNDEIPYQSIEWNPLPHGQSSRNRGMSVCYVSGWNWWGLRDFEETLNYFDQHYSFWEQAIRVGKVDVLIIPDPHMAEQNPRITSFINRPIIFKDVPIMPLVPIIHSRTHGTTGEPIEVLRWYTEDGSHPVKPTKTVTPVIFE